MSIKQEARTASQNSRPAKMSDISRIVVAALIGVGCMLTAVLLSQASPLLWSLYRLTHSSAQAAPVIVQAYLAFLFVALVGVAWCHARRTRRAEVQGRPKLHSKSPVGRGPLYWLLAVTAGAMVVGSILCVALLPLREQEVAAIAWRLGLGLLMFPLAAALSLALFSNTRESTQPETWVRAYVIVSGLAAACMGLSASNLGLAFGLVVMAIMLVPVESDDLPDGNRAQLSADPGTTTTV